jgi:hypothetical protein
LGPVSGNWSPASTQIADLEKRLFPLLLQQLSRERSQRKPEDYLRQYVGFVIGGRKVIYVNGVHRSYIEETKKLRIPGSDWEHQAIFVCDGGDDFFGAEYDVDTKSVANLLFNGRG